ncbi:4-aminobutyrate---pyruvate transaminase [Arboricoccus pini]|uniref:4-aminobutyrate---pyruvate transaminase n=1 Tax=Arboricoccus pini TaxID=1963835 RepID=A0A212R4V7_9PROT|nr:aminotransferase [Arboricoccus pini]SNB67070.1 4-aminobutyrate---pyruvate transaminase [Arboricoccus pini]
MPQTPNSLHARDIEYTIHPYTNLRAHEEQGPLVITRGDGVYVFDDEGKSYIEGMAGLWCTSLGFSEKRLAEAARKQMEVLPYSQIFSHRSHEPVIELAERVVSMAPASIAKAFFVNSGSEAIDTAIKLIWYYQNGRGKPNKKRIIGRRRAYHGITIAAGHLTGLPYARTGFDLPMSDRFFHVTPPSLYSEGNPGETEEQFTDRLATELDTLIITLGPDTVAAFFAEPVMGAGGVIVPPLSYFPKIQAVLRKHDVLMVSDEVICGFGRTGNWWGAETMGIEPDLMTIAKQLSSAYLPIAGVLMSQSFYEGLADQSAAIGNLGTGYTYSGHPVAAAVALETLRIYDEDEILNHVREVSPHFKRRLDALGGHPLVGEARGVGLIGAVEIVKDKASKTHFDPAIKINAQVAAQAQAHGVILRPVPIDSVGICPPLIITRSEIDMMFDGLEKALDGVATSTLIAA